MPVLPGSDRESSRRAAMPIVLVCIAVAGFYAAAYGVRQIHVPIADDSFFYVWAVRFAGRFGIADSHLAARPAFPLVGSALGTVGGASPWMVAVAFPITMAGGLGLAGGAIAARWGLHRWGAVLFAVLTATSAVGARLVAGKTENLLTLWLIAAIVVVALWGEGRSRSSGIAVLALAASLSEWPFLAAFLVLLAGAALSLRLFEATVPDRTLQATLWPVLLGLGTGLALVFLWNRSGLGSAIQALPPSFAYRSRFFGEVSRVWPILTAALALLGWWAARRGPNGPGRGVRRLFGLWLLLTGVVLVIGLAGLRLPTYRALTFALPLALAVAAAPFFARRVLTSSARLRRAVGWAAGIAVAVAAIVPAAAMWYRDLRPRASLDQISAFAAAARYSLSFPAGPPTVMVVNRRIERVYFYQRLAADMLPPHRRDALVIFPGSSTDALAGRPTFGSDLERDRLTSKVFAEIRPTLEAGAPILTGRSLDKHEFAAAAAAGAPLLGGGTATILRGPSPSPAQADPISIVPIPDWWQVMLLALLWLVIAAACGAGWSRLALPGSPLLVHAAVAPAFGVSALAFVTLVMAHLDVPTRGPGGVVAVAVAVSGSAAAALGARRTGTRSTT